MTRKYATGCCLAVFLFMAYVGVCSARSRAGVNPLEFLKAQEMKHRGSEGEVYLGTILTIHFPPSGVRVDEKYRPFFLELTDLLKSPLRKNYRLVFKGYSDSAGPAVENLKLSVKRAENLKKMFVKEYYMDIDRITTEGFGETEPVCSNETAEGRRKNRRVEIHIYGDVSETVRFIEDQEEGQ